LFSLYRRKSSLLLAHDILMPLAIQFCLEIQLLYTIGKLAS
jgi:hypothetical protein